MTDRASPVPPATLTLRLIRAADRAVLSTLMPDGGAPYGSLVLIACAPDGAPLMLLSDLADHTRNLKADSRASLLIDGTGGLDDPLTGARAALQGEIVPAGEDLVLRGRFLRRHPSAQRYAAFGDFNLYRFRLARAHLVAGFGRIHWLDGAAVLPGGAPAALSDAEAEIVAHMNEDHGDAVALYANRLLGLQGVGWRLTGVDAEGCDLRRGGAVARLDFERWAGDAESARVELVRLVKMARRST
jgi:putative heme iron utilization protein